MEEVIEYVNIPDFSEILEQLLLRVSDYNPRSYIECGARSFIMYENPQYVSVWNDWLNVQYKVHSDLCQRATGFNTNSTNSSTVPPHVDIDVPKYYNLLLPVYGVAKINLFEANANDLEFRHGQTHWQMVKDGLPMKKIDEFIVDKPTLLDTNVLHDVQPINSPRCVWCTRWINIPEHQSFKTFKTHIEDTFNNITMEE